MSLNPKVMLNLAGVIVSALLFEPSAPHQANPLPTLDEVVSRNIQELGGQAALAKSGALVLTGDCASTVEREDGPVEILVQTPKVSFDLGHGALRMGFDGETVWRHAAEEGLQKSTGREHAEIVTIFDPTRVLLWKQWYPEIAVKGAEKVGDRDVYLLETHPGKPETERLFIDQQTGLLIRDEVMPRVVFTFSDYRAVDGVRMAFTVRQDTPAGVTYTYHFKEVRRIAADNSRFQPR